MRIAILICLAACGSNGMGTGDDIAGDDAQGSGSDGGGKGDGSNTEVVLPPVNAKFDYQLGGAYTPPTGVTVVSRDRTAPPANGIYNLCYINGFQIQPDEESMWMQQHPDLILRDGGSPVIDPDWDEMLIDVSTSAKRDAVAAVVGGWIDGCHTAGFDAIEIDNLDSYTRSHSLLTEANAIAAMKLFSDRAHMVGMAIAQKNSSEIVVRKADLGTDFAVAEECNTFDECEMYTDGYGDHVIVIEYVRADFNTGCNAFPNLSIVLRDRDLVLPSSGAYVHDDC
jgi:hypothetical protein